MDPASASSSSENTIAKLPGNGHIFGNFNNYYSFHQADSRTSLFPRGFFERLWLNLNKPEKLHFIDIGCNEGVLSLEIMRIAAEELVENGVHIYMFGVDIDSDLIAATQKNILKFESSTSTQVQSLCHPTFMHCDILRNIDVVENYMHSNSISGFNVVSLFSITMWVHLTNGDEGLSKFLEISSKLSLSMLIVEPQNWCSYKTARKRCNRLDIDRKLNFKPITIRGDDCVKEFIVNEISVKHGLSHRLNLGKDTWKRSLMVFLPPHLSTFDVSDLSITAPEADKQDEPGEPQEYDM